MAERKHAVNVHDAARLLTVANSGSLTLSESPAPQLNSDQPPPGMGGPGHATPGRGCSVVLLPEDETKLTEKIAYHEATGRIMPRARRRNTVNPRIPYPRKPS